MMNTSFQSPKTLLLSHLQETWVSVIFTILIDPHPPSPETVVARYFAVATYAEETVQEVKALTTVWKVLDNKHTPEYISMDEFQLLRQTYPMIYTYLAIYGLKMCSTGNSVAIKRKPSESWINTYNPDVTRVWIANIDLQ